MNPSVSIRGSNSPVAACHPPFYPARPVNGGPLEKALPKSGEWYYEPKYNGWRALVHVPTGTMFNRKLERLSIEKEFAVALERLRAPSSYTNADFEWLDCEALERRHNLGRGSLVVLDWLNPSETYVRRRRELEKAFFVPQSLSAKPSNDFVFLAPSVAQGDTLWNLAREANVILGNNGRSGTDFYEGVVAKRADSLYPRQRRSPDVEFPFWMKHRWQF